MLQKMINYLSNNGQILMITGFILVVANVLILMYLKLHNMVSDITRIPFSLAITGLVIYVIGRVFMIMRKIRQTKSSYKDIVSKDDV